MADTYPDRRDRLFGRERDIDALCGRAHAAGLTVVAARPLMGKTWTLVEAARRLEAEGTFIVGCHESKGAETSHLLYAVSNLYTRWLEDSRMWDQARSLWERHRDGLIPRIGQAVGGIIEKLGSKLLPEGVAAIVQKAFDGLAQAQDDLLKGGLQLAPLPYDEALALTNLVTSLSGKRVVLILDAWEKSPSIAREFATLESFAKNPDAWPGAHLMLAVRDREIDSTKLNDEAMRRARDLCRVSSSALVVELAPMDAADLSERARLLAFLRAELPAARDAGDQALVDMIDGYPGVVGFWLNESTRRTLRTPADLRAQAANAQALRWLEFDALFADLKEPALSLAARLAIFPRVDAASWSACAGVLLADGGQDAFDALVDATILQDAPFPTFGHDTRYVAARRWFLEHRKPLLRRAAGTLVDALAGAIADVDARSRPFFECLLGCSRSAADVGLDDAHAVLIACAEAAFGETQGLFEPGFLAGCAAACARAPAVGVLVGLALISRGVEDERRERLADAIADYTQLVDLPATGAREKMQALTNRAIATRTLGLGDGLADCNRAVDMPGVADSVRALALLHRAAIRGEGGDKEGEIADYTRVIATPGCTAQEVIGARFNRAVTRKELGDDAGAQEDFAALIALPATPPATLAKALRNRAAHRTTAGDADGALADYTALLAIAEADAVDVAIAAANRANLRSERGDWPGVAEDCTRVIEQPEAEPQRIVRALILRSTAYSETGNVRGVVADLAAAMKATAADDPLHAIAVGRLSAVRDAIERSGVLGRGDAIDPTKNPGPGA